MQLRVFTRDLKIVLPEMQQLIQTLIAGVALLAGVVSLWHQIKH